MIGSLSAWDIIANESAKRHNTERNRIIKCDFYLLTLEIYGWDVKWCIAISYWHTPISVSPIEEHSTIHTWFHSKVHSFQTHLLIHWFNPTGDWLRNRSSHICFATADEMGLRSFDWFLESCRLRCLFIFQLHRYGECVARCVATSWSTLFAR